MRKRRIEFVIGILVCTSLFCGQSAPNQGKTATVAEQTMFETEASAPTVTPFPTPRPPDSTPFEPPSSSELQEIVDYANALNPSLIAAGEILERDGEILNDAQEGNDAALCDGRLEEDNEKMKTVLEDIRALYPPSEALAIHNLLIESGEAWTESLDNVALFCDTGNQLYKIPAALKFWEAAAKLQDAANRFWQLIVAKGLEDWVQR